MPKCTAGPPRMDHLRAYIGFSYIKYSRTSFIPFYYTTEVLNLGPYWTAILGGPAAYVSNLYYSGGPAAYTNEAARRPKIAISLGKYRARGSRARSARGPKSNLCRPVRSRYQVLPRSRGPIYTFYTHESLIWRSPGPCQDLFSVFLVGCMGGRLFF